MNDNRTGVVAVEPEGGAPAELAYVLREASSPPVLYLHGLGSSKADFMGALDRGGNDPGIDRTVLAIDFPGCGRSPAVLPTPSMDRLAVLTLAVAETLLGEPPVVIGHSMGGLVGLLAATTWPDRVSGFISVEGNLAPEDCFLSRQAVEWRRAGGGKPEVFLADLMERQRRSGLSGHAEYAERAPLAVSARLFVEYSEGIVASSDERPLLEDFLGLDIPAAFVHGKENGGLSYLGRLETAGATVQVIPGSAHFPHYSNPEAYYAALRALLGAWAEGAEG